MQNMRERERNRERQSLLTLKVPDVNRLNSLVEDVDVSQSLQTTDMYNVLQCNRPLHL